jgi:hypothetical protein
MSRTRKIDSDEARVLGVLMEKEQTTPDAYPMTIKSVIAGCNQRTSREPVTDLSETQVVEALDRLRRDALAWRSQGARAERWEHLLDRRWGLDRRRKAVMTLLLVRGPQSPGEIKTRAERMFGFASKDEVESLLAEMAAEVDPLVEELRRRAGHRETRWQHLMAADGGAVVTAEIESVEEPPVRADAEARAEPPREGSATARLAQLEEAVDEMRRTVEELKEELRSLRRRLGDEG